MINTEKAVFSFLVVLLSFLSVCIGYGLARISDTVKAEAIKEYKDGRIDCQTVGGELVCRSVSK